ncbi:MAG: glycosyltransferase [bacterium]|nr:glycosyltransferase [bacterium]
MKICVINNLYKPYNRGGAEQAAETIAHGLIKAGHEVFIIATKPAAGRRFAAGVPRVIYLNGLYYNLNKLPEFTRLFWHFWNMFNFINYFKIKKILAREKCGAVIMNNLMGVGFLTPLAAKRLKIKRLQIIHDIQLIHPSGLIYYGQEAAADGWFAQLYSLICRRLFNSVEAVIFPSNWLKDYYRKRNFFPRSKIEALPNPVKAALPRAGARPGKGVFLFIGQIEKHKGVFLLIEAFNKIYDKYPEAELLLAGDGSRLEQVRRQAAGNRNIKFLGWPGGQAADELLNRADYLVYPSLVYENCPNAIQRALAAGLPVIASNLGGIPELLNGGGVLFKPADANDLAETMTGAINGRINPEISKPAGIKTEAYIKKLEEFIK